MKYIIFYLFLVFSPLHSREVVEVQGSCKINWSQGHITCEGESAEGQNKYGATIAAKVIAQRNLLEVVKGVRIDSMVTVKDGMFSSDIIKSRVEGVIRGGQIISNKYSRETKSALATIKLQMGKDLLSALLSDPEQLSWNEKVQKLWNNFHIVTPLTASTYSNKDKATIEKLLADLRKKGNKQGEKYLQTILASIDSTSYSGILIDVSELPSFKKAMIVKLVDQNGHEVYPSDIVSRETLLKRNTSVGYIYGLDDARSNKRVFNTPVEIKASQIYKKRYSNIVLTNEQIQMIHSLDSNILKDAKVILVLGD